MLFIILSMVSFLFWRGQVGIGEWAGWFVATGGWILLYNKEKK